MPGHAPQSIWRSLIWLASVIAASVIYRRLVGKPVLFFTLRSASFLESSASGHCNDNVLRQLGHARNCLAVGVVENRLIVRPSFPFNLMFLPEIYGLEHDMSISDIVRVEIGDGLLWRKKLVISFLANGGKTRSMTLYLKEPERLAALLVPSGNGAVV